MSKTFKVMTGDIVYLPWCKLVNMQGDLKSLDDENLRKLKGRILTKGFKAPFKVWFQTHTDKGRKLPDPKCTFKIVDGVQRTKALSSLVDDGIHVPDELPCVPVYAATLEEALDDLVGFASVYGYTSKQQAKDFILEYPDLDWLNIPETVDLPGVDMSLLVQEMRRPDKVDEDEIPEVTKAITKTGDLWILGEHRVLCGDATKKEDVEVLMDGKYGALSAQYKQKHEPAYYCYKVNIVTDLFLGSGSTLIACEKTGRKCYGIEIDPHYCDVIVKRWEEYTGKKATRK